MVDADDRREGLVGGDRVVVEHAAHPAAVDDAVVDAQAVDLELVEDAAAPGEATALRWWEDEWRAAVYERCLAQVRDEVRPDTFEVFRRFAMQGHAAQDVADALGVPRTRVYNVKLRIGRRLVELARRYEDA